MIIIISVLSPIGVCTFQQSCFLSLVQLVKYKTNYTVIRIEEFLFTFTHINTYR